MPANTDNFDALLRDYVEKVAKKENSIDGIRGELKDILNEAKNAGFLKTSIRKAVRKLRMTQEQIQAKTEVDEAAEQYFNLCKDLPLFKAAA
jgi:uncharacterized protein (UPF0335 family)